MAIVFSSNSFFKRVKKPLKKYKNDVFKVLTTSNLIPENGQACKIRALRQLEILDTDTYYKNI